jgi:hypothetical protein
MFTSVGYAFVLVGIFLGSRGRALEVFRLTATVGIELRSLFFSPSKLVYVMRGDIGETIVIALGAAILLTGKAANLRRIPSLLFLCTLAVTLVIFSSRGIEDNYLIGLHVAASVLLMDWVLRVGLPKFGLSITAVACFIVFLSLIADIEEGSDDTIPNRAQMENVIRVIGTPKQSILAETPLLPILAGQRPYLLDPFGFPIMIEKRSSLADPMW